MSIGSALIYPIAIGLVISLVNNKHVRKWARQNKYFEKDLEEIDAIERLQKNEPVSHSSEQSFELEIYWPRWALLLVNAIPAGLGGFLLCIFVTKLMSDLSSNANITWDKLEPALSWVAIALALIAFASWLFYTMLLMPTVFKIAPEAFYIKRWWPCSSPIVRLSEVRHVQLKWGPGPVEYGGRGKIPDKISFMLNDGKKYAFPLSNFTPTSLEKLVQFLAHSSISDKVASFHKHNK